MANEEQLKILKSGVEKWNRWRRENRGRVDLRGADLRHTNLRDANFQDADLRGTNLQGTDLHRAKLVCAALHGSDLTSALLVEADLCGAYLGSALLFDADLRGADLFDAALNGANLRNANLSDVDLFGASLNFANLEGANLFGANLRGAKVLRANLSARFDGVSGLGEVVHRGPSAISPEALEWAQGKLPEAFLKGIGFKDWEILSAKLHDPDLRTDEVNDIGYEIINLRTKGPIQVNTLFISYARVDSGFVEFLEKALDKDGIRSWRDVHDMVAGPIQPQIERAIDLNGTALLVLSKNSLGSDWVEWEVQKARGLQKKLEEEGKRDAHVLCPVAIDDAWKDSKWSGPLMNQLLKYNILDFSKWEEEEVVEKVYSKLKAGIAKYYSDIGGPDE